MKKKVTVTPSPGTAGNTASADTKQQENLETDPPQRTTIAPEQRLNQDRDQQYTRIIPPLLWAIIVLLFLILVALVFQIPFVANLIESNGSTN